MLTRAQDYRKNRGKLQESPKFKLKICGFRDEWVCKLEVMVKRRCSAVAVVEVHGGRSCQAQKRKFCVTPLADARPTDFVPLPTGRSDSFKFSLTSSGR
jgi:hypothetical protein